MSENKNLLTLPAQTLLSQYSQIKEEEKIVKDKPRFLIDETLAPISSFYEKVRNLIDYKEIHLLRRAAIERILKRRVIFSLKESGANIAQGLVKELILAGYLPKQGITEEQVSNIAEIIEKYFALDKIFDFKIKERFGLIWGLAAAEIEKELVVFQKRKEDVLVNFICLNLKEWLKKRNLEFSQPQILIAVYKGFLKVDEPTLNFLILKIYLPQWEKLPAQDIQKILSQFSEAILNILEEKNSLQVKYLLKIIKKIYGGLAALDDILVGDAASLSRTFQNSSLLEVEIKTALKEKIANVKKTLIKTSIRAFIYIFITKMIFAFLLEFPYEFFILEKLNYLPLAVNLFFPPLLMLAVTQSVRIPGPKNIEKLWETLKIMIYQAEESNPILKDLIPKIHHRSFIRDIFSLIYILMFGATFVLLIWLLKLLNFSWLSMLIFIFFLCLISFFAFRVIQPLNEMKVIKEKRGIFGIVTDFFTLPFLIAGRWMSGALSRINIFLFIFDFIIEAPLKTVFEVLGQYLAFMREKKEEI